MQMMEKIVHWVRVDSSVLGSENLEGSTPTSSLAVPMMMLCLIDQLETMDSGLASKYEDLTEWCLQEVMKHVQVGISIWCIRTFQQTFTFFSQ